MTCAQAKAFRRKARIDPRYAKQCRRDALARQRKYNEQLERQKMIAMRKGASRKA